MREFIQNFIEGFIIGAIVLIAHYYFDPSHQEQEPEPPVIHCYKQTIQGDSTIMHRMTCPMEAE